jgi:Fe(3+) dicitrate transport protein
MKISTLAHAVTVALFSIYTYNASADERDENDADDYELETVTIYGSVENAQNAAGSAHFIGPEELDKFKYTDIQRVLREVPGVSIQIEDGFGLRPNISIRGVATERSDRITLLEDNVLVAPAPYAAPAAYYFPTVGRINSIEVVKGPSAITQGPYTIGGALNLISTPIPSSQEGLVLYERGQDNLGRLHATYGNRQDNGLGYLIEIHDWKSDGFQTIDRSDTDTGLDVRDYTLKVGFAPEGSKHSVELKWQFNRQDSNQSYLGLTDQDFREDADRRYGLSALDNITTQHQQVILRYGYEFSNDLTFDATLYNNNFDRNWFKTEGIDLNGSPNAQAFSRISWFNYIQTVNEGGTFRGFTNEQLRGILDGTVDTAQGAIQIRANAREYYSRGIQFGLDWQTQWGNTYHEIEVGLRLHEDQVDRLQRNSTYQQVDGQLILSDLGEQGNAGNQIQDAEALAFHVYDRIAYGNWVFTPGFRVEIIDQSRTQFNGGENRVVDNSRENDTDVFLPGIGALYQVNDNLTLVSGVHKGFSAPTNSPGVREEEAVNYELGFRYNSDVFNAEIIGFVSDYDNLLGVCTASSGTDCEIGDAFNGDAAFVQGLEVLLGVDLGSIGHAVIPLKVSYTYTDAEFDSNIANTDFFGNVSEGDPIPYIPTSQGKISIGLESTRWSTYLNLSYIDEVCVRASCGLFERTDESLTVDWSINYDVSNSLSVFGRIENLTDQEDILGRQPYGARPNKDRTASIGARYTF